MQIRDKKTLGIDTIFPIVLIIVGLALATVSIFKDGVPRLMSPYIFNQVPMKLIYNTNSESLNGPENELLIKSFIEDNIVGKNETAW